MLKIRNEGGVEEWCVVEFQGELQGTSPGEAIGVLSVDANGKVGMIIGQHEFKGEVVKLGKAFLVVEKNKEADGDGAQSMDVRGVVRRKLLFNSRPKVITSKRE